MISINTPVQFSDPLPERVDLVIIGAGVIGTSTAWFAANRGMRVLLLEKGRVAGEQSSRNWGWIRQQGRDPAELPIMMESNHIWRGLAEKTGESGLSFTESGCLYLARSQADLKRFEEWEHIAKDHGLNSKVLSTRELTQLEQPVDGPWLGGLLTPGDGRAEPWLAVPALAKAAHREGVSIIENCAARTIGSHNGQVSEVFTEIGKVSTSAVVVASGAWSSVFCANLGVDLPQLSVRSTVAKVSAPDRVIPNVSAPGFAIRQRNDGGYSISSADVVEHYISSRSFRYLTKFTPLLRKSARDVRLRVRSPITYPGQWGSATKWSSSDVSPFEKDRILDPPPSEFVLKRIRERLPTYVPSLTNARIEKAWAGLIDVSPDAVPYICEASNLKGLFIGTGLSGHGFGIGPATGRILADLVASNDPGHNLQRFRFNRFTDGSRISPGPY